MRVAVISLFPEMFRALTESGISRRAVEQGLVAVSLFNPRDFATDKHRTVDDRPYGGGPGMLMKVAPLLAALEQALLWHGCDREQVDVVYLSPQGQVFDNFSAQSLLAKRNLVLIAGRYEGIDERFIEAYVDSEWSIGDYVLSGGELPAMVMMDAMIRRLPGALGDAQSAEQDSFEEGLLDCPHYTRPEEVGGRRVPDVLLSGDHAKINRWRQKQALGRTWQRRPELLHSVELTPEQSQLLAEFQRELP